MRLKTIGVLGAGTAGKGIIRSLAGSGLDVVFCELTREKADRALKDIGESLGQEKSRWGVTESEKRLFLSRISGATDMREMIGAQVVIEVVPCSLREKQKIFKEMDRIFPKETILVSNSATLCVSDIVRDTLHPERIAGMHFPLPVPRRPIVEVVKGRKTTEETLQVCRDLAKRMKKTSIEVFEMPGLITTRVMIPYINEAMNLVMEGLASPKDVDEAICLGFKLPIGPLAMADKIGLDTLLHNMEHLFKALGELQYRPCPMLRRMVREEHLGVKTRRGFFCYDENENAIGCPKDGV